MNDASTATVSSLHDFRNKPQDRLRLLEHIVALIPGYVYWLDQEGRYQGCNDNLAHALGLASREAIVDLVPYANLSDDKACALRTSDAEVMQAGVVTTREEPGIRHDGSAGIFLTKKAPLYDEHNQIVGLLAVSFDITDQKQAEQQMQAANEKSKIAAELQSEFIQNMEHDIRTPFNGICGIAQYLCDIEEDADKKELLGDLSRSAGELLEYCNGVLDFSKIASGTAPVISKKFSLQQLVDQVVALEKPAIVERELQLTVDIREDTPEWVIGDAYRLHRVLMNLLSNAIKFTHQGEISIELKVITDPSNPKDLCLYLVVRDTGVGIPREKLHMIYEAFSRVSPSNQNEYRGLGLGLRIVKQFIDEMGGEIDVDTKLDKGTAFACSIPLKLPLVSEQVSV